MSPGRCLSYGALFRKDAALISFLSYMAGAGLTGNAGLHALIEAVAVTCFPVNFIYSFNSWADRDIDRISKPLRPIPSGRIAPANALRYCRALLAISISYPFFLYHSPLPRILCLILPCLGILYSSKPFYLRTAPVLSIVIICTGLIVPMLTGYFSFSRNLEHLWFFGILECYCLGVVPLKKIEELHEDRLTRTRNLYDLWGSRLLWYSVASLTLSLAAATGAPMIPELRGFLIILLSTTLGMIGGFKLFAKDMKWLYTAIIYMVIGESILFILIIGHL